MNSLVLIEDNQVYRDGFVELISDEELWHLVGAFGDAESAMKPIKKMKPDLILLDIELPGMDGVEAVAKLKWHSPNSDIVMLTVHEDSQSVFSALEQGATGYITKTDPYAKVLEAMNEAMQGGAPMSHTIAKMVVASFKRNQEHDLTPRETEVLKQLAFGLTYGDIAEAIFVSTETVKSHIKNIYSKLNVRNKADAVVTAMKKNII